MDPEQVVRAYFRRLFDERDLSVCDEVLAPGYVDHDAPAGTPPGPGATRTYVAALLRDDPGLIVRVEQVVAIGRTVALTATWRGTEQAGEQAGEQATERATGRPSVQTGLVLIRLDERGRFVERRSAYAREG